MKTSMIELTDEQLATVTGGCGRSHHESSESFESVRWNRHDESDCDDRGRRRGDDDRWGGRQDRCGRERGCGIL